MSWAVGDLAVCIDAAPRPEWSAYLNDPHYTRGLREGATYQVRRILFDDEDSRPCALLDIGVAVGFAHTRFRDCWPENRFVKVRPDEHEACEPEFVTLLKRTKRSVPV